MGGGCHASTSRESIVGVCRGKINRRDLHRATMMLMTLLGFLWAVLLLIAFIAWSDPTCFAKMYRFVRRPAFALATVSRPARRFLSSVLPWHFYPTMAPPGHARTHRRRSRRFRH